MANHRWGRGFTQVCHFLGALGMSVLAAVPGYAGTQDGGLFTSNDQGHSWKEGPVGRAENGIRTLVVDMQHPETVFAGTATGVLKSSDGGLSWQALQG